MIRQIRARWTVITMAAALILTFAAAASAADVTVNKGIFAKGKLQGGVKGGYVATSGDDYLMLGLGVGYNLADGLTAGLDFETWLIGEPTVNKLAPWIGYTFYKMERVKPYIGAFYRQNWVSGYDDYQDVGARAGVYTSQGRSYVGVGLVYEYRVSGDGVFDRDQFYPEVRFAIGL